MPSVSFYTRTNNQHDQSNKVKGAYLPSGDFFACKKIQPPDPLPQCERPRHALDPKGVDKSIPLTPNGERPFKSLGRAFTKGRPSGADNRNVNFL